MLLKGQFETFLFVWTIENLAVPLVAFSAQTQQLWGRRKLFWHYKAGILLLLWRFTGKIRQCAVLPLLQFPSTLFISPPPFPFWLLFHILFQPKQGFYLSPSPSPFFCCCFRPPAPTVSTETELTTQADSATASQVSLNYAPSSRSQ